MSDKIKKILAYLIPVLGGVAVFFLTAKEEKEVKFHAVQGILFWVMAAIIGAVIGIIPFIGWIIEGIFGFIIFLALVLIIFKLLKDKEVKLPIIYELAEKILKNV